jgi:hypothetical protein
MKYQFHWPSLIQSSEMWRIFARVLAETSTLKFGWIHAWRYHNFWCYCFIFLPINKDFYVLLSNGKRTPFLTYKSLAWVSSILTFVHVFGTSYIWKVGTACIVGSCLSSDICKCVEHLAINVNKFNGFVLLAAKHLMTDCFESQPWECI